MSVPKLRFQHEDGTSYPEWKDFISLENCCEFISKGATPTTYGFKWEEYQVLDIPDKLLFAECIKLRGKYQVDLSPVFEDTTKTANE